MTNNEIKKALGCCTYPVYDCDSCPLYGKLQQDCVCGNHLMKHALNYIKHLESDLHLLKNDFENLKGCYDDAVNHNRQLRKKRMNDCVKLKTAKSDAIKEFWSRIQNIAYQSSDWSHGEHPIVIELDEAKDIYTEMVGDEGV